MVSIADLSAESMFRNGIGDPINIGTTGRGRFEITQVSRNKSVANPLGYEIQVR